mgnify:CR=1 FL=1
MPKTTTQKIAELKEVSRNLRRNIYRSVKLAAEILSDTDWIAQVHGGNLDAAEAAIESEYFSAISGLLTLGTLLDIYRHFPSENQWIERNYNLSAMHAEWEDSRAEESKETLQGHRTSWKKEAEKLKKELDEATTAISDRKTLIQRINDLEIENAELRGRLAELEKLVERQMA